MHIYIYVYCVYTCVCVRVCMHKVCKPLFHIFIVQCVTDKMNALCEITSQTSAYCIKAKFNASETWATETMKNIPNCWLELPSWTTGTAYKVIILYHITVYYICVCACVRACVCLCVCVCFLFLLLVSKTHETCQSFHSYHSWWF